MQHFFSFKLKGPLGDTKGLWLPQGRILQTVSESNLIFMQGKYLPL